MPCSRFCSTANLTAATCGGKKRSSCPKSLVARKTSQISKETVSSPALTWKKQSFLPGCLQTSARTHNKTVGCPFPLPRDHPTFQFTSISETTVLAKLLKLPIFKAAGCNQITNCFLRNTAAVIAPSLTYLFNLSIKSSSEFPTKSVEDSEGHPNLQTERPTQQPH